MISPLRTKFENRQPTAGRWAQVRLGDCAAVTSAHVVMAGSESIPMLVRNRVVDARKIFNGDAFHHVLA
jgi:hypothetical protein